MQLGVAGGGRAGGRAGGDAGAAGGVGRDVLRGPCLLWGSGCVGAGGQADGAAGAAMDVLGQQACVGLGRVCHVDVLRGNGCGDRAAWGPERDRGAALVALQVGRGQRQQTCTDGRGRGNNWGLQVVRGQGQKNACTDSG